MKFPHHRPNAARSAADDQAARSGPPWLAGRSCCCSARPTVMVVIPATSVRPHSVDLLLCGHHYQASRTALAAANAVVTDKTGTVLEPAPLNSGR